METEFRLCSLNVAEAFRAWLFPHLLAVLVPPVVWLLRRNRWCLSLRIMLAMLMMFGVFTWMIAERIRLIAASPTPGVLARDYFANVAWTVMPLFVASLVLTMTLGQFVQATKLAEGRCP